MTITECTPQPQTLTNAIGAEAAATVAAALKAIADPLRLRMLSAIATDSRGEACVCDLAELADVAQPTVSHHLRVMKDTGLLTSERRGTWVFYRIAQGRREALTALLDAFAPATTNDEASPGETSAADSGERSTRTHERSEPSAPKLADIADRVDRLAHELADEMVDLSPDLVVAVVRESYAALARTAKLTQHIVPLTERFARQRLADLTRDRDTSVPQVLFVCVANAGRSQLAAALTNQLAAGKVVARSAGTMPAAQVHPHVRSLLEEMDGDNGADENGTGENGADESADSRTAHGAPIAYPKPLTDDAVRAADVVVTMGCGDVCPIIPGVQYEDWAVGDPALASAEGVAAIRDDIETRVKHLISTITSSEKK